MSDQNLHEVEDFIAGDLLVTLGAIRMALRWAADDPSASALTRLGAEMDALTDRSRGIYRQIRAAPQLSVAAPDAPPTEPEPATDLPSEEAAPEPEKSNAGLPPMWLADVETLDTPDQVTDREDFLAEVAPDADDVAVEEDRDEDLSDSIDELLASAMGSSAQGFGAGNEPKSA